MEVAGWLRVALSQSATYPQIFGVLNHFIDLKIVFFGM